MTFEQVLEDIKSLAGVWLRSIKPGSEIVVEAVEEGHVLVRTKKGELKSRPIAELQAIWEALVSTSAIHVDSVLSGSGSSRNQPETILANLAYIEFLRINGRKHLTLGEPSHPSGSIKRASHERTSQIIAELKNRRLASSAIPTLIVVTSEMGKMAQRIEEILGSKSEAVEAGVYSFVTGSNRILLISSGNCRAKVADGTYALVIGRLPAGGGKPIEILGRRMYLHDDGDLRVIIDIAH